MSEKQAYMLAAIKICGPRGFTPGNATGGEKATLRSCIKRGLAVDGGIRGVLLTSAGRLALEAHCAANRAKFGIES